MGGMKCSAVWCFCLVFPTETHQGFLPEQVIEVLLKQGGQQQEPQMVSLPSCCSSDIPCPTAQPACANYLSLEYALMHICCLRGLLVGKFLLGNCTHWCLNIYLCVFWHGRHIMFINNCLEIRNSHDFFPVMCLAKWNLEVGFQYVAYKSRRLHPFN